MVRAYRIYGNIDGSVNPTKGKSKKKPIALFTKVSGSSLEYCSNVISR